MEIFKPYSFDKGLFFTTLILMGIGLIMVFSSSGILASENHRHSAHFFINQLAVAVIGIVIVVFVLSIRKPFYQNSIFIYGLLLVSLALLVLCLFMPSIGNIQRWIHFFGLRFQPSELAKLSLVLFFASYLESKKERLNELKTLLFPLFILVVFILLIKQEPDLGTAVLICFMCALMLFIGGTQLKHLMLIGIASLGLFTFYLFKLSYTLDRVIAFIAPTNDPLGKGFQIIQSKLAVGSGGLLGASIGESTQKLFFLPCAHTDFIYAIAGEELGLIGTLSILLLFLIFLWRGLVISRKAPDLFSQIAAAGLTFGIFSQALLNISVALGLSPPTGLPLPLISYGRSSLLCTLLSIGILLHISQRKGSTRRRK